MRTHAIPMAHYCTLTLLLSGAAQEGEGRLRHLLQSRARVRVTKCPEGIDRATSGLPQEIQRSCGCKTLGSAGELQQPQQPRDAWTRSIRSSNSGAQETSAGDGIAHLAWSCSEAWVSSTGDGWVRRGRRDSSSASVLGRWADLNSPGTASESRFEGHETASAEEVGRCCCT